MRLVVVEQQEAATSEAGRLGFDDRQRKRGSDRGVDCVPASTEKLGTGGSRLRMGGDDDAGIGLDQITDLN